MGALTPLARICYGRAEDTIMQMASVKRLRKELAAQIREMMLNNDPDKSWHPSDIANSLIYDDGKEAGQHTEEHGQFLSFTQTIWVLKQSDDAFEQPLNKDQKKIFRWRIKPQKQAEA